MKAELIIEFKRRSFYYGMLVFIVMLVFFIYRAPNLMSLIGVTLKHSEYVDAGISPWVNGFMCLCAMFGSTIFLVFGCNDMMSDKKYGVFFQRKLMLSERKYILFRVVSISLKASIFVIIATIIGVIAQLRANEIMPTAIYSMSFGFSVSILWLKKAIAVLIICVIEYYLGFIIGYIFNNKALGMVIAVLFDQIVASNLPHNTGIMRLVFGDSKFIVIMSEKSIFGGMLDIISLLLGVLMILAMAFVVWLMIKKVKFGYEA